MDASFVVATARGLVGSDSAVELEGRDVVAVAPHRGGLVALVDGTTVMVRVDGASWTDVGRLDITGTCVLSNGEAAVVGTELARLAIASGGAVTFSTSFDQAPGRDDWFTPWGGPPATRSLVRDAAGSLYVNVHVGGILRSNDDGGAWEQIIDVNSDVHQVVAHPSEPGRVFAATAWGLAVFDPGAEEWSYHTDGLHAHYCRAVAVTSDVVYLTASDGPGGGRAALYRADLSAVPDVTFERCDAGGQRFFGANLDTYWLDAAADVVLVATPEGSVFTSTDGGSKWDEALAGLAEVRAVRLT